MRTTAWILAVVLLALPTVGSARDKDNNESKAGAVRVYRFDNLDIEGHVKTPHLMYFLKRIRNKFRTFRLPRQNFTRKVLRSKEAKFLE